MQPGESLMSLLLYIAHDSCATFRDILLLAHCGIILSEYRREWRTSCRLTVVTEKAKHDFHVASIVSVRLVGLKNLSCLHISNTWSQRHCVFGLSVHQCVRTYMYVRPYSHTYCHTSYYWYSITTHSFTLGLNLSFSANPPYRSLSFFSFRFHYMDFPDCLLLLLSISVFLLFSFSVFTLF